MKKWTRSLLALLLIAAMVMTAGCGAAGGKTDDAAGGKTDNVAGTNANANAGNTAVEPKHATIGVAFYQDTGLAVDATKAYLESLSDTLNVEFVYAVLTQTDESANLSTIQNLISAGVDGIICTMDLGTNSIIKECEAAGVYLAGYLCDYETSFKQNYDGVFKNEYFLGTAIDGQDPDDTTVGTTMFNSLIEYNERNPEAPLTHVSMAIFPAWAFPSQMTGATQFVECVEEYNKTAETPITVDPLDEEVDVLMFSPMNTTYFSKHTDIDAIISMAAGTSFVYPVMVQAGVDKDIKLFTTGFEGGEDNNFGTKGTQTFQQNMVSAAESITYPLVLLLNKINGVEFADMPEDAERISTTQFCVNSDEDMEVFKHSLYYTGNAADAMFTPEQVLQMTAFGNPEATYAGLRDILAHMNIEDIAK